MATAAEAVATTTTTTMEAMATAAEAEATTSLTVVVSGVMPAYGRGAGQYGSNCPNCGKNNTHDNCKCKLGSSPRIKQLFLIHLLAALYLLLTVEEYSNLLRNKSSQLLELVKHLFPKSHELLSFTTVFTNSRLFQEVHNASQCLMAPSSERFEGELKELLVGLKRVNKDGIPRFDFPVSAWKVLLQNLTIFLEDVEDEEKVLTKANIVFETWVERRKKRDEELKS